MIESQEIQIDLQIPKLSLSVIFQYFTKVFIKASKLTESSSPNILSPPSFGCKMSRMLVKNQFTWIGVTWTHMDVTSAGHAVLLYAVAFSVFG